MLCIICNGCMASMGWPQLMQPASCMRHQRILIAKDIHHDACTNHHAAAEPKDISCASDAELCPQVKLIRTCMQSVHVRYTDACIAWLYIYIRGCIGLFVILGPGKVAQALRTLFLFLL